MTPEEANMAIHGKLIGAFGYQKGLRIAGVIAPSILKDFSETVRKRKDGSSVTEEYRTDDRAVTIVLTGRYLNHKVVIDKVQ